MSHQQIKSIAEYAPTTEEELASLGILGEQPMREYGGRLVQVIKNFIEQNNLHEYIQNRPTSKRAKKDDGVTTTRNTKKTVTPKTTSKTRAKKGSNMRTPVIDLADSDDDEFGNDIDYDMINIP